MVGCSNVTSLTLTSIWSLSQRSRSGVAVEPCRCVFHLTRSVWATFYAERARSPHTFRIHSFQIKKVHLIGYFTYLDELNALKSIKVAWVIDPHHLAPQMQTTMDLSWWIDNIDVVHTYCMLSVLYQSNLIIFIKLYKLEVCCSYTDFLKSRNLILQIFWGQKCLEHE